MSVVVHVDVYESCKDYAKGQYQFGSARWDIAIAHIASEYAISKYGNVFVCVCVCIFPVK